MDKLLGILPYIYFEEPVQLGEVTFLSVPDWKGRNHTPSNEIDLQALQELSACFPTTQGLSTNERAIKSCTYFLVEGKDREDDEIFNVAHKAVTLLRYAMLRPDNQAVHAVESTYVYVFALPPAPPGDNGLYQGWINFNQDIWVSAKYRKFPPPGWDVDFQLEPTSNLEDIEKIEQSFHAKGISSKDEAQLVLAMDWYNHSFLRFSIRNVAGLLVDIATAFETLFQLPRYNKTQAFKRSIRRHLGIPANSPLDNWATSFYGDVRSATVHTGRPATLVFKHPEAQAPHLAFLWSAQRIFRECLAAKMSLPRHVPNDILLAELVPNEIHLQRLRRAGNFEGIQKQGLLEEVNRLRAIPPSGNREDIIWLGKELLGSYKAQYLNLIHKDLPSLDSILQSKDDDPTLGLKYHQLHQEFKEVYFRYITGSWGEANVDDLKSLEPITSENLAQVQLEHAIYRFCTFAGWALLLLP